VGGYPSVFYRHLKNFKHLKTRFMRIRDCNTVARAPRLAVGSKIKKLPKTLNKQAYIYSLDLTSTVLGI
jgi:hypothetical protein